MAILNSTARCRFWGALLFALGVLISDAQGPPTEFEIKAVYLVKFVQFVDWPSSAFAAAESPLVIGVLGTDRFGRVLDDVANGEVINGHRVIVRRYRNVKEIEGTQVLFIATSEAAHLHSILAALKGQTILTVSDIEGFSYNGGIVRFLMENNKVHFCINVDAAKRANLQISSKLLQLAEIVHDDPGK